MTSAERFAFLVIDGVTAYNSIGAFNRELGRVLQNIGFDVIYLDADNPELFNQVLRQAVQDYPKRIAACLSFSGFAVELGDWTEQGNLWQRMGIPMLTILLDHPCYFLARHKTPSPAVMRVYPNANFMAFHRDYIRSPYRTSYCKFGAMTYGRPAVRREPKAGQQPLIIFPKSGSDPRKIEEVWALLPRLMQRVIHDSIDHYWGQTARSGPVEASVLAAADAAGLELRNDLTLFTFFITQIDDYIRKSKVNIMVRQLLSQPVHIYGSGLDYIDTTGARGQILPPLGYDALIDKFGEAFAIISMNPNIDDECHDRPYSAMGAGALPISDINPWWEKNYPDLMPYSFDFRDRPVAAVVEKVLADPVTAANVAWQVSERQLRTRTFDTMVNDIVELAIMHSYFTFNFKPPQPYFAKCGA
ncbi:MAG: hypothetical protein JO126_05760 [Alphaproteobacteria bacterium]|nr:hypothetical protein [Alphaproteobacteria bacterium]MBV8548942.1 hypothetical protein [Alphaproteobacteria bacterium]